MIEHREYYRLTITSLENSNSLIRYGALTSSKGVFKNIDLSPFPFGDIEFEMSLIDSGVSSSFIINFKPSISEASPVDNSGLDSGSGLDGEFIMGTGISLLSSPVDNSGSGSGSGLGLDGEFIMGTGVDLLS